MSEKREILRHFTASIAYHATKAIRDAPAIYPEYNLGKGARTPKQIIHHIAGLLTYAHSFFEEYDTTHFEHQAWDIEIDRFYEILSKLDNSLKEKHPKTVTEEQLLQGPLSDAMAHIGQLLMLRRLSGSPVPSENFIFADIAKGVVGPDQPEPVSPDE
ncbi:MAG: hypothetical protein ACFFDD_12810 [Promethearchaeota archaeon]